MALLAILWTCSPMVRGYSSPARWSVPFAQTYKSAVRFLRSLEPLLAVVACIAQDGCLHPWTRWTRVSICGVRCACTSRTPEHHDSVYEPGGSLSAIYPLRQYSGLRAFADADMDLRSQLLGEPNVRARGFRRRWRCSSIL